jgi:phytoene dehydrogenase-like protein
MLGHEPFGEKFTSVRLASLDVALSALPVPARTVAIGIDRPLYLAAHSTVAKLAPPRGAVIHVGRYLAPGEEPSKSVLMEELEELLDLIQPGWRGHVVERRFLPAMVVTHALQEARTAGQRPSAIVPGYRGLYVAGDWVGPHGMLADATLSSARAAAQLILDRAASRTAAE